MTAFHTDPKGEAYAKLIDVLIKRTNRFLLVDRFNAKSVSPRIATVLQQLEPYLVDTFTYEDYLHGYRVIDSASLYGDGTYYIYRCTEQAGDILKQAANRLQDWQSPNLPEDLCFLSEDGSDYLSTVAHEKMYGMNITTTEAEQLMEEIPGLFFDLPRHEQFAALLEDAIKHQTDYLCISTKGITELPKKIAELTDLETLIIHEQELRTLPPELFELSKLQHLEIMTADLEEIPAEISKLKLLKSLKIYNGTSFAPTPGWKAKPKEEISLKCLPPEIGDLRELESLEVVYSAISDLPAELKKLTKLKHLIIRSCLIEHTPDIVNEMPWIKYKDFSSFISGLILLQDGEEQ